MDDNTVKSVFDTVFLFRVVCNEYLFNPPTGYPTGFHTNYIKHTPYKIMVVNLLPISLCLYFQLIVKWIHREKKYILFHLLTTPTSPILFKGKFVKKPGQMTLPSVFLTIFSTFIWFIRFISLCYFHFSLFDFFFDVLLKFRHFNSR